MLRSMFTAISSLNLHQSYLDVVANNLANANTTGFKASRLVFQDQFAQLLNPGAGSTDTLGGTNPTQIGLGVQLGYISPIFTQGMLQSTGRNLDMSIQGDGFFVYGQNTDRRYSREGSLMLDSKGYLVNASTGMRVQGWQVDSSGTIDTTKPADSIEIVIDRTIARATERSIFGGNLSSTIDIGDTLQTTMGVYDSLGTLYPATIEFTRTDTSEWGWKIINPPASAGEGKLTFDENGQYSDNVISTPITIPGSEGASTISIQPDMTNMTMLATNTTVAVTSQDGLPAGSVSDVYVTPNTGSIFLVYSNGMRQQVAQVAIARFTNPSGLLRAGHTTYLQGLNSGEPEIGTANSGGRGVITSGYLEASNVDMAQEFTNMILAQRGFQASSRVITTSDEIMQELVNLKR